MKKNKSTISVVLATYNEEKKLKKCLEGVKDIADEIIIVDGSSSDKTVQIARKYGAKIRITTNKPNFHINKQMAIDMASCDWILQLDADEVMSETLSKEILIQINKKNEINGYWIPRKNWFLGRFLKKGGQYPDLTIRLYRNGKGKLPQRDVHEQAEVKGKIGYLNNALLHYPYKNFSEYFKKWQRYTDLIAGQIKEEQNKKNIAERFFYALTYLIIKPFHWFLITYIRHKGFMDLWPGFVFSVFSALRFPVSYIKYFGSYRFAVITILAVASALRFYDFQSRWGLGGDDARDALIALEAIKRFELPAMGSFSSAGPFVFGGMFYWFIIFSYLIMPFFISSPWIFLALINILLVYIFIRIGKELGGNRLAIILGVLSAISPQLVIRSLMLGQHTFISLFTSLAILSLLFLIKTKRIIFAFFIGVSIGTALSFHYQAINLLLFFPAIFLVTSIKIKDRLLSFLLMMLGFVIPLLPMMYWDSLQGFANLRNLLDYFLIAQERIYVPNSWKLYIFKYIPEYWSFVIGRFSLIAGILGILSALFFIYSVIKKKISASFIILGAIFIFMILVGRYYKGERSEGYLLYLLPFMLIFSAWSVEKLLSGKLLNSQKLNNILRLFGLLLILIILIGNFITFYNHLKYKSPVSSYKKIASGLYLQYPGEKFSIFNYEKKGYTFNYASALSLIMTFDDKIDKDGKKIGISCGERNCPSSLPRIFSDGLLVDLTNVATVSSDKKTKIWSNANKESVYDDLIGWLNKNQLKSSFNLNDYIMEKIRKIL